ncbi:peptidase S10, serine carboxypeptidase, Alpha/Beta hydrolase fold protein [Artemisia annua]|uniref:Peptidase S10, serine carboxypeptidase, Alpha/Beta hydrolase fold protein n=1 Tax=Artemisia annua TaxID=35608 RepID=A0A2U1MPR6_ARTAN|nr:peptidase S10, serine carboxypeptidase, Alpha/Beta hydrolase fold protein [Artemisia annua]
MIAPYVGTEEWITSLDLPIERVWDPWYIGIQIAGYQMTYAKNGYSLTYATVKAKIITLKSQAISIDTYYSDHFETLAS